MNALPVHLLKRACQIFLDNAYPDGIETIPEPRRAYLDIPEEADVADYLPTATNGVVRILTDPHPGYSLRLGCSTFPYLRLTFLRVAHADDIFWVCGVDTHDAWRHPDHADAAGWMAVQAANREVKNRIERAWEAADILTHNSLLRQELHAGQKS